MSARHSGNSRPKWAAAEAAKRTRALRDIVKDMSVLYGESRVVVRITGDDTPMVKREKS